MHDLRRQLDSLQRELDAEAPVQLATSAVYELSLVDRRDRALAIMEKHGYPHGDAVRMLDEQGLVLWMIEGAGELQKYSESIGR